MQIDSVANKMAEEFSSKPFDFVTRRDIEIQFVNHLRTHIQQETSESLLADLGGLGFEGKPVGYKTDYIAAMDSKLRQEGGLDRVHSQVKFHQHDHHYDIVVLAETITNPIQLSNNGSMRFDETDVEAVIDLEYVINRAYFPTEHSLRDQRTLQLDDQEFRKGLKKHRNNLDTDFEYLNRLPDTVDTYYLLFSNLNYLFREPLSPKERDQEIKIKIGKIAQKWITDIADDTTVYYAHPRGHTSLNHN